MNGTYDYVNYDEKSKTTQSEFKKQFEKIEQDIDSFLVEGVHKKLAKIALEEAYMWIGKAIRNEQILRKITSND